MKFPASGSLQKHCPPIKNIPDADLRNGMHHIFISRKNIFRYGLLMKYGFFLIAFLVLVLLMVPASAFTAKTLIITVNNDGDATVDFSYQLTWYESFAYSVLPNKEQLVKSTLKSKFPSLELDNIYMSKTGTDLIVRDFAEVSSSGGATTYRTPELSFRMAQNILEDYPRIDRVITPDFSPEETIVRFPGSGDTYTYTNADVIPGITYMH
jgi:hypothetical protein